MTEKESDQTPTTPMLENMWSGAQFQALLSTSGMGFFVMTETGKIIDADESLCLMLGYEKAALLGTNLTALLADEKQQAPSVYSSSHKVKCQQFETCYQTKSRRKIWVKVKSQKLIDQSSKAALCLVLVEDVTEEKNVQLALNKNNEARQDSLNMPARISYVDRDMRYQFVNDGYEAFYKLEKRDVIGKKIYKVLPTETWKKIKANFLIAFAGQPITSSAIEFFNGRERHILVKLVPEFEDERDGDDDEKDNADGEVKGVYIVVTALTELRQAEEHLEKMNAQLRVSEENWRQMMKSSNDVILVVDDQGEVLYANSQLEELFGYDSNELIGANIDMLVPEVLREKHKEYREEYLKSPTSRAMGNRLDLVGRAKDGEFIPVEIGLGKTKFNARNAITVTIRDATILRQGIESSQELAAILESSGDAVFRVSKEGVIRFWSKGAETLYGYKADEIVGEMIEILLEPGDKRTTKDLLSMVLGGKEDIQSNEVRLHKDGQRIEVFASIFPIKNQKGDIVALAAVHRDISQLKNLEEQLRHAQKMETAGKLAGGIAHDFNNILTVMQGYCALIEEGLPKNSDLALYLDAIDRATHRAGELTRQLLAFSRKQLIEPKVLQPNEQILELTNLLARTLGEDINLKVNLDSNWNILEDPAQLEQVVLNLTMNARHAMNAGGTLAISTKDVIVTADPIEMPERMVGFAPEPLQAGSYVQLTIADSGTGMSRDVMERIFEPFYTTKEKGKGTGLGLSVVFGMVTKSQGAIRVESGEGQGSSFHVYFPRATGNVEVEALSSSVLPCGLGKVLIVEDDVDLLMLAKAILTSAGYSVYTASEPSQVLENTDGRFSEKVDLILSDVVMPGMSGPHFIQNWLVEHPDTHYLFMSGYADDSALAHSLDSNNLIQKPFKAAELIRRVKVAIENKPDALILLNSSPAKIIRNESVTATSSQKL